MTEPRNTFVLVIGGQAFPDVDIGDLYGDYVDDLTTQIEQIMKEGGGVLRIKTVVDHVEHLVVLSPGQPLIITVLTEQAFQDQQQRAAQQQQHQQNPNGRILVPAH